MRDLIFDVIWQSAVKDVVEGAIAPAVDLASEVVELYNIFVDFLSVFHGQIVQLVFHISDGIVWTKVGLEFLDELLIVVHPDWASPRVTRVEQVWFEPLEGDAL